MPLYEYKCHSCGKTFEVLQKFSDDPVKTHEGCGGVTERLISATAFHLKGSGWYATDYAKGGVNSPKPGDSKPSESGSEKTASNEGKSDSGTSTGESRPAASASETSKPAASKPESPKSTPTVSADSK